MWPFSSKPDRSQLRELRELYADLEQRFKVLEREQDELHVRYRRLRGSLAVEARDAPRQQKPPAQDEVADPGRALTKDELRRKYLVVGTRKLGGDGELPHEDS